MAGSAAAAALPGEGTVTGEASPAISAPPEISVRLSVSRKKTCPGIPVAATLSVRNDGGSTVLVERVDFLPSAETAYFTAVAIPAGAAVNFTATLTASAIGFFEAGAEVRCREPVTGAEAGPFRPPPVVVEVRPPGELVVSLAAVKRVSLNQQFAVTLTVTNTGGMPVEQVRFSLSSSGGIARSGPASGQRPSSLAPGEARTLRWTFSASEAGAQFLAGSVEGTTCGGISACGAGAATLESVLPARLVGAIDVSATRIVAGQWITSVFRLEDAGGAAATAVRPILLGGACTRSVRGPLPAASTDIEPGNRAMFTWTWSTTGAGTAHFSGSASCRDALSGKSVPSGMVESPRVSVLAPARLAVEALNLMPEPVVHPGDFIMVSLIIANKGGAPARVAALETALQETVPGVMVSPSKSTTKFPFVLEGGEIQTVVWNCRAGKPGVALLRISCSGTEGITGFLLKSATAISNRVAVE